MNGKEFKTTRRNALKIISAAIIGLVALLTAQLTGLFVRQSRKLKILLKKPANGVQVEPEVFIRQNEPLTVLSRTCPHLGCKVKFDAQNKRFVCPCHGSRFTLNGRFIHGPAKKDLRKLTFKKTGNRIIVTL